MATEVWFRRDIENAIHSAQLAAALCEDPKFREGFNAAIEIIAASFGLNVSIDAATLESGTGNRWGLEFRGFKVIGDGR